MKKAITTFAKGHKHTKLLEVAIPSFYKYAHKHNYDLVVPSYQKIEEICKKYNYSLDRPPAWYKVVILKYLLEAEKYDLVLWLDCDTVITKTNIDISNNFIPSHCIQGLVSHNINGIPFKVSNTGVWLLTQNAIPLLEDIWNNKDSIESGWWEQGSLIDLMFKDSKLQEQTYELDFMFNVHKNDKRYTNNSIHDGKILHATTWDDQLDTMKYWASFCSS